MPLIEFFRQRGKLIEVKTDVDEEDDEEKGDDDDDVDSEEMQARRMERIYQVVDAAMRTGRREKAHDSRRV